LLLLRGRQGRGELDLVLDDEVAPLARLLGDGHPQPREPVLAPGLRRDGLSDRDILAVDGRDGAIPAAQRLLEIEFDRVDDIVALADVQRMGFLKKC